PSVTTRRSRYWLVPPSVGDGWPRPSIPPGRCVRVHHAAVYLRDPFGRKRVAERSIPEQEMLTGKLPRVGESRRSFRWVRLTRKSVEDEAILLVVLKLLPIDDLERLG